LAAFVAVALLVALCYRVLTDDAQHAELGNVSPTAQGDEAAATAVLLDDLEQALGRGDADGLSALAVPGVAAVQRELAGLAANVRELRIRELELRYVGPSDLALAPELRERLGADAWVSDVQLTWQLRGVDPKPSTVEVPVVSAWADGEARFGTARVPAEGGERRVPLWFVDRVAVRRTADSLVLAADGRRAKRLSAQSAAALAAVRRTLPDWRGPLVVEGPATDAQFQEASGLGEDDAAAIAAVTTTTDGSGSTRSPVHIYVNPEVFDPLGRRGQQIVISHEAAHVALDAATTSMPLWLSEGMADYVALVGTSVPTSALAAQILRLVRRDGVPDRLPGGAEFDGGNADLGAWYEGAWLAARLIAERRGEEQLLEFYRSAERDQDTKRAFRAVLGTTERQFTREWRRHLADLAR
jgi:hypothetical protein